jgi:hypothetical protein
MGSRALLYNYGAVGTVRRVTLRYTRGSRWSRESGIAHVHGLVCTHGTGAVLLLLVEMMLLLKVMLVLLLEMMLVSAGGCSGAVGAAGHEKRRAGHSRGDAAVTLKTASRTGTRQWTETCHTADMSCYSMSPKFSRVV